MTLLDNAFSQPGFQWNETTARHLLNRAGFGVPPKAVQRLAAMKPQEAVDAFVDFEKLPDVGPAAPADLPSRIDYKAMREQGEKLTPEERMKLNREAQRAARAAMDQLQAWWLQRMCKSQRPLQEKMTLFWHGHFATSAEKVKDPVDNLRLNEIFRAHASGNFRELTTAVGKSSAMMRYLDQVQSNRQKPNENWARELMELFTLGIGNYTEQDIKEAARAFTGWIDRNGEFFFARGRHDNTPKTVLGVPGNHDGDAVIQIVTSQPACAKFICTKLWKYFAYDNPEPEVIEGLAATMRGNNMDVKPVLRQMFSSRAFYQDKAMFSQVKSPAQLVVNLLVQLGAELDPKPPVAQLAMRAMGQSLFYPPNVKGWDGGQAWINTNTLLVRYNFSNYLVSGVVPAGLGMGGRKGSEAISNRREAMMEMLGQGEGGGEMMMQGDGMQAEAPERDTPAGQDAMPRDIPAQTLYNALQKRRAERVRNRVMEHAPFHARDFFAQFDGKPGPEIIGELEKYFLGFALSDDQRTKLLHVLAQGVQPDRPVPVKKMAEEDLRATVQLLLSTAEYQVC